MFREMLAQLKEGGYFVLNHPKPTFAELDEELPGWFKRDMAKKKAKF